MVSSRSYGGNDRYQKMDTAFFETTLFEILLYHDKHITEDEQTIHVITKWG